jgi:radical SAM superfamily enzyme YgiQ (UPF0313 family)
MVSSRIHAKTDSLLSKEQGTVYKDPGGKISICLVYPNTYHVGMSNLGFQGMYTLLNERSDVVCERAFLPDEEDRDEYLRTGTEAFSMESRRPLSRFDIVAFSVSFENDYPHVLRILRMSKIPVRTTERSPRHPLVIMGGVCAFFNPEPVSEFFDICFVGEAEEMISEFLEAYKDSRDRGDLYDKAIRIEGIYLPGYYEITYTKQGIAGRTSSGNAPEKIQRRVVKDMTSYLLRPSIITPETEFSNMYLMEAMRGCPWSCRFCVAGYVYKPVRKKDIGTLKEEVKEAVAKTKRVGLIAPSLTDYPHTRDILCMDGVDFSITSLRASPMSAELIKLLRKHKSVSIAPEAGTQRLRKAIDKRITEEDIVETARLILSEGIETLRLYFMVGLPTEGEKDIDGIISLVKGIREVASRGNIVLTLSTFVPKPFTPFQWHPMERMGVIKTRLKSIKKALMSLRAVKVFHDVPKYAYMQGLFSRGDRRVSRVLEEMSEHEDWKKACTDAGIDADFYLFRQRDFSEILPWDFIDNGIPKEKLWAEYQKALATEG